MFLTSFQVVEAFTFERDKHKFMHTLSHTHTHTHALIHSNIYLYWFFFLYQMAKVKKVIN